jgi:hypothetical protein
MLRILFGMLFLFMISCATTTKMSEETYELNKAKCLEKAQNFSGATLDDLIIEFGRPVFETRDIANNFTLVFSCLESSLFIHFTFNQFGEMQKYEVKRTMLAN